MTTVISVRRLSKTIKQREILKELSFEVQSGDCLALIGPNGAGKTTLMNCLLGDLKTKAGQISVLGKAPDHPNLRDKVAVLFQDTVTDKKLTVKELIAFQQAIYPNPLSDEQIDAYLHFSVAQKQQLAETLSGGQRRLLAFVLLLIGQPEIVMLDEPTAGMDTSTRQRFWRIVQQLKTAGKTIIYSSHYIEEVEHTADRILVLHQGELLRDTTPYAMQVEDCEKQLTLPIRYQQVIAGLDLGEVTVNRSNLSFNTRQPDAVWAVLQEAGIALADLEIRNRSLLTSIFKDGGQDNENL